MTDTARGSSNKNPTVRYEKTLAIKDDEGAGSLVGWVRIAIAFMIVSSLVSIVLVGIVTTQRLATSIGGMGAAPGGRSHRCSGGLATSVGGMGVLPEFAGELAVDQTMMIAALFL